MRVWLGAIYVTGAVSGRASGSIADPTIPSVKSSEGTDSLYRNQIQELPTCVIVNRAIVPKILTKALLPL